VRVAQESRSAAPAGAVAVVGASAGGVEALSAFARALPGDLVPAVIVVLHLAPTSPSVLPEILARHTTLPVARAGEGQILRAGHVYVAPPDRHVVVADGATLSLSDAPKENGHRPAIDPAMRSAADAFGAATTGVLLSGTLDDGVAGLIAIKAAGGVALVQDPDEALYDGMPRAAMRSVELDGVLPVARIAASLSRGPVALAPPAAARSGLASVTTTEDEMRDPLPDPAAAVPQASGEGTRFTCPDCGGVLFAGEESRLLRFRCSVGHQYSPESLLVTNLDAVEGALWTAVRTLEDRVVLLSRMAERARAAGHDRVAEGFERQARDLVARAATIRTALAGIGDSEAA
jgi:two-component system, chemotaxis family, protein-glutamate methylesterase/glutaminase